MKMNQKKVLKRKTYIHQGVLPPLIIAAHFPASSVRLNRPSSGGSTAQRRLSEDSDSSGRQLDLAELKRSRLQHPGKISMFGADPERVTRAANEDAHSHAEKARELFDLPATEKILSGTALKDISNNRISRLVDEERDDPRLHGFNAIPYLLLCAAAADRCISSMSCTDAGCCH
jgi:hypothetical protein